jgi:sugar O-acyltransferase (sialic acid O-acetyltransferase NeuD family)
MKLAMVGLDKDLLDALGDQVVAIFDPNLHGDVWGIAVIGGDDAWPAYKSAHPEVRPLIAIDVPVLRRKLADEYGYADMASFIAPTARLSARAGLGTGVVIQHNAYISADVRLDDGVRINVGAQIHHDCIVGSFATVAPTAALMGSVTVGAAAYIGAGAVILQGGAVGDGATVGAGAVVTRPVAPGETVVGAPARPILARNR